MTDSMGPITTSALTIAGSSDRKSNPPLIFWVEVGHENEEIIPRLYNMKANNLNINFDKLKNTILSINSTETKSIRYGLGLYYIGDEAGGDWFKANKNRVDFSDLWETFNLEFSSNDLTRYNPYGIERIDNLDIARITATGIINFIKIRIILSDPYKSVKELVNSIPAYNLSNEESKEDTSQTDVIYAVAKTAFQGKPGKLYMINNDGYVAFRDGTNAPIKIGNNIELLTIYNLGFANVNEFTIRPKDRNGQPLAIMEFTDSIPGTIAAELLKPEDMKRGDKVWTVMNRGGKYYTKSFGIIRASKPTEDVSVYYETLRLNTDPKYIKEFVSGYTYVPGDDYSALVIKSTIDELIGAEKDESKSDFESVPAPVGWSALGETKHVSKRDFGNIKSYTSSETGSVRSIKTLDKMSVEYFNNAMELGDTSNTAYIDVNNDSHEYAYAVTRRLFNGGDIEKIKSFNGTLEPDIIGVFTRGYAVIKSTDSDKPQKTTHVTIDGKSGRPYLETIYDEKDPMWGDLFSKSGNRINVSYLASKTILTKVDSFKNIITIYSENGIDMENDLPEFVNGTEFLGSI